jgi:FkbM family methyltransferase
MSLTNRLKQILPHSLRTPARHVRELTHRTIDVFLPHITKRSYLGFTIFYSKGTGIIDRIRFGSTERVYEPELGHMLVQKIKARNAEQFIDIGANIGLISLYVKKHIPTITIHAFEPGPHQAALLSTTLIENNLAQSIHIHTEALSDKPGFLTFLTHSDKRHVGGDGFKKTKLSGNTTEITVRTDTFDNLSGPYGISGKVIKMDVEGAELLVLRGMETYITAHKPTIFLEINPSNYLSYNYSENDLENFFSKHRYRIMTLEGKEIPHGTLHSQLGGTENFYAEPI